MLAETPVDSELLGAIEVATLKGEPYLLRDLWREKTAVLVFLRHLGCMFTKEQLEEFGPLMDAIRERGADLAFVTVGSPLKCGKYCEMKQYDMPMLVDEARKAYKLCGFRDGALSALRLRSVTNIARALKKGHTQGLIPEGPAMQLGGALVIRNNGEVVYHFIAEVAGDHPDPRDIIKVLDQR